MDSNNTIYYCVVQFLQKPHPNISQYVIVPDSWIKPRGDRICVLYPDVEQSVNLNRFYAMNPNKKMGDKITWTPYLSELKHTAKDFQDAKHFIMNACALTKTRSSLMEPELSNSNNDRKRRHDNNLEHGPTAPKVKNQRDINPVIGLMAEHFCKEFIPAFLQRSLSRQFEQSLHTNAHEDDSEDDYESDIEPTNKRVSSKLRVDDSDPDYTTGRKLAKRRVYTFVLPPEYDENDSRWTLRHRELGPGLDKLVPEFDVYVDKGNLTNILNICTSATQLARLLFMIIFSDKALVTCSLTGKPNMYATATRPGLDKDGRNALLKFVQFWQERKQWDPVSVACISANLRVVLTQRRRLQARLAS